MRPTKMEFIFTDIFLFFKLKAINLFLFKWQMDCSLALGKLIKGKVNPYGLEGKK